MEELTTKNKKIMYKVQKKQKAIDVSLEEEKTGKTNSYSSLDEFLQKMNG